MKYNSNFSTSWKTKLSARCFSAFLLTQVVDEQMEGNVVMVTLGAEGGVEAVDEEPGTSYVELKPSTTLLVPVELMEGHEGLVGCPELAAPELHRAPAEDEATPETHGDFSLMLDMDEEVKGAEAPPLNDHLEFSAPPTLSPALDDDGDGDYEPMAKLEVLLLEKEAQDAPVSGEACEQEQGEETARVVGADGEDSPADGGNVHALNTDAEHQPEEAAPLLDAELRVEDEEPSSLAMPEAGPQPELPEDVAPSVAVEEEGRPDDENPETEAQRKEAEKNGPVGADTEVGAGREAEPAAVEEKDLNASETEEDSGGMNTDTETTKTIAGGPGEEEEVKEEEAASPSRAMEETPAPQEKKSIPPKPSRRTTRGKSVTFISSLTEENEELQEDGEAGEGQSHEVPVSLPRTPRKSRQSQEPAVTPRRSSRRAQQEPPGEALEAVNQGAAAAASRGSSPARRVSQRSAATRSSQGGLQEDGADAKPARRAGSRAVALPERRTSTPRRSSRRTPGSAHVATLPLEAVREENEQEEAFASAKHTSKHSKEEKLVLEQEEEEEERKAQASSPGRTTRHSSRSGLTAHSQVGKTKLLLILSLETRLCFHPLDRFMFSVFSRITPSEHQEDEKTHWE